MRFAEVVDSLESAREFMELNKITPSEIIVIWDERIETQRKKDKQSLPAKYLETRNKAGEENNSGSTMPVNVDTHAEIFNRGLKC